MKCFVTFCYILSFIWVAFPAFQRIQPPSIGDDSNWPANFARGVGTCWNYQLATVVTFLPNDELWSLWKTVEFCGWCRWWHPLGRPQRWVHLFPVDRGRRKRKARGADLAKTQSHRYPLFYQEPPRFRWPQRYDNEYGDTPNTFRFFLAIRPVASDAAMSTFGVPNGTHTIQPTKMRDISDWDWDFEEHPTTPKDEHWALLCSSGTRYLFLDACAQSFASDKDSPAKTLSDCQ